MASLLLVLVVASVSILIYVAPIQSAKIVGFPMMGGSQYIAMKRIAEELAKRNHEVSSRVKRVPYQMHGHGET